MKTIRRWNLVALVCVLAFWSWPSSAEVPVAKYAEFRDVPQFKEYLVGLGRGVFWANVLLRVYGKSRLFCIPEKLALDEGVILSLIDQEIRSPSDGKPWGDDDPVEMVMAFAFARRFPCPR
jgi:hypothetical protein